MTPHILLAGEQLTDLEGRFKAVAGVSDCIIRQRVVVSVRPVALSDGNHEPIYELEERLHAEFPGVIFDFHIVYDAEVVPSSQNID